MSIFRSLRSARQLFDGAAVEVACREVHFLELAAFAEDGIDEADAFDQLSPVHAGNQPHAGDDIAHGQV